MNKVFKVIWSEARNAYVVVSEMAKSHGTKSCSTKKLLAMLIATGVMTCASMAPAMAANLAPEDYQIEAGNGASASGQGSVAIGNNAQASGLVGIAIGRDAVASGTDSIAIGSQTKATELYSVAVGNDIKYIGQSATAVGQQAYATGDNSTAIGTMTNVDADWNVAHQGQWRQAGNQSTAIGAYAGSWGDYSTSVGTFSKTEGYMATAVGYASKANSKYGTALGDFAEAKADWGVAIGASSVADREGGIVGAFAPEGADSLTWRANVGAVSVGSATLTRQITNVAAGTADTDAVNVGQLKNSAWKLAANGVLTEAEDVKADEYVDFSGDQNVSVSKDVKDGVNTVKVELNKDLIGIESISNGDAKMALNGAAGTAGMINGKGASIYMQDGYTVINSKVAFDQNGKIHGVTAGTADSTDAVNGSQLHAVATEASKHSKVVGGNNINVEETDVDGQKFYKVNMNKDIILGDLTGKYVNISGTNGTIETTGYIATQDRVYADKGAKLADIDVTGNKISNGASSIVLDGSNVKVNDKVTIDQNGKISGVAAGEVSKTSTDAINGSQLNQTNENVAALDKRVTANEEAIKQNADKINKLDNRVTQNEKDIKQNATDIAQNKTDIKNLGDRVTNVEELAKKHTTVTAGDNNITVDEGTNADGGKEYKVALNNKISVDSVTAGDTTISDKGLEIKDGPSVTKDGINAGNKKITGVADGDVKENSKDAVNGGQLHQAKADINNRIDGVENQVVSNTNRINQLGSRVNKVGAGAAALAALHPMDFDPDDKLTFSAGYGNYGGENAAAIGAYYRPDEKVMFSVGGTVGNGENMVNAGVSFSLDRTNHVSNSRTALAREVIDLRGQLAVMGAKMAKMEKAFGMLDESKTKLFPDIPANHWAYEYIAKLAGNGYIEGYPDGNFGGDRLMTRYEFAAMLYRAIENGAALEEKIIKEFEPELGRIRVDRISGEDGDRNKIERVRVNDTKGERDHYGNKLAK
jgi:autotransporter adhesin